MKKLRLVSSAAGCQPAGRPGGRFDLPLCDSSDCGSLGLARADASAVHHRVVRLDDVVVQALDVAENRATLSHYPKARGFAIRVESLNLLCLYCCHFSISDRGLLRRPESHQRRLLATDAPEGVST